MVSAKAPGQRPCPEDRTSLPPAEASRTREGLPRNALTYSRDSQTKKSAEAREAFRALTSMVPGAGFEPARGVAPGDFESPSSASSDTPALRLRVTARNLAK